MPQRSQVSGRATWCDTCNTSDTCMLIVDVLVLILWHFKSYDYDHKAVSQAYRPSMSITQSLIETGCPEKTRGFW